MAQRVVVTAGASGIGLALAARFLAEGAEVAVCDVDPQAVARFAEAHPDCLAIVADVTSSAQMAAFLDAVEVRWRGVDVVCANAGTGGPVGSIETLHYAEWQRCLSVNLDGAFLICRWAARLMRAQGSGVILITSSTAGLFGYPMRSPYAVAKWGLIGLTKTLAMELGPVGVRVNAICPGSVEGPRMDWVVANEASQRGLSAEEVRATHVANTSMKTWVEPSEIADTAVFLASPAAAKISGQVLSVDGHTEGLFQ